MNPWKILIATIPITFLSVALHAQNTSTSYQTAVGIRAGGTSGITVKHFTGSSTAIEGIVGFWKSGLGLTALLEQHAPTDVAGLQWYYGAGGHVAFWDAGPGAPDGAPWFYEKQVDGVALGLDGIVGIEYKIQPIPIAISLDLKPLLGLHTGGGVHFSLDPGLGVKFTL